MLFTLISGVPFPLRDNSSNSLDDQCAIIVVVVTATGSSASGSSGSSMSLPQRPSSS